MVGTAGLAQLCSFSFCLLCYSLILKFYPCYAVPIMLKICSDYGGQSDKVFSKWLYCNMINASTTTLLFIKAVFQE